MRSTILSAALAAGLASTAAPALAQTPKPLPFFVADFRGAYASIGRDTKTAEDLNVEATQLPGSGFSLTGGAHVYLFRRRGFAIGAGAEWLRTRATSRDTVDADGFVTQALTRGLTSVAGIVSVNFGGRDGWSYLSGGTGPLRFESTSSEVPHGTEPYRLTHNAGGGARWFVTEHLAAGFDVRFYLTRPTHTLPDLAGRNRLSVRVIAIGISLR